jgi:hypothetical protein
VRDGGVVKIANSSIITVIHNRMRSLVGKSSSFPTDDGGAVHSISGSRPPKKKGTGLHDSQTENFTCEVNATNLATPLTRHLPGANRTADDLVNVIGKIVFTKLFGFYEHRT